MTASLLGGARGGARGWCSLGWLEIIHITHTWTVPATSTQYRLYTAPFLLVGRKVFVEWLKWLTVIDTWEGRWMVRLFRLHWFVLIWAINRTITPFDIIFLFNWHRSEDKAYIQTYKAAKRVIVATVMISNKLCISTLGSQLYLKSLAHWLCEALIMRLGPTQQYHIELCYTHNEQKTDALLTLFLTAETAKHSQSQ